MGHRPFFRSSTTALLVGLAAFGLGWWALYDAYDRRGKDQPRLIRPFTWW